MVEKVLAIETATDACSVALAVDGEILSEYSVIPRQHTQLLLPMVDKLLATASLSLRSLDLLSVSYGPGSFTGIRIGVAISQGLALGADIPLVGVSTLMILAEGAHRLQGLPHVFTTLDARMGQLYWGEYRRDRHGEWLLEREEQLLTPEQVEAEIERHVGCGAYAGDGWHNYPELLNRARERELVDSGLRLPRAEDMLPMSSIYLRRGKLLSPEQLQPCYLRQQIANKSAI